MSAACSDWSSSDHPAPSPFGNGASVLPGGGAVLAMVARVLTSERTMRHLRAEGVRCDKVEQWIPGARIRRDLFGWMDVLAFDGEWVGIQCCAMSGRAAHLSKYRESPDVLDALRDWLAVPGHRAELWAWRKLKVKRGGKAMRWTPSVTDLSEVLK